MAQSCSSPQTGQSPVSLSHWRASPSRMACVSVAPISSVSRAWSSAKTLSPEWVASLWTRIAKALRMSARYSST